MFPRTKIAAVRQNTDKLLRNHFQRDIIRTIVGEGGRKLYARLILQDRRTQDKSK
jgi:hypothetical protein